MGAQKRTKNHHDVLQRIPLKFSYSEIKEDAFDYFERYERRMSPEDQARFSAVNTAYFYDFEPEMDANGVEKLILMIAGMLYEMEHDEVNADQAFGTNWDIEDFETGNYNDLLTPADLVLIREDIKKIKTYLSLHSELLD